MNKLLIITFSILIFIFLYIEGNFSYSSSVFLSSYVIQVFSIVQIFSNKKHPYSLKKMFYLFSLFFFGFAPLLQHFNKVSINGATILKDEEYTAMNIILILIFLLYELFYKMFYKKKIPNKIASFSLSSKLKSSGILRTNLYILLISAFSFFIVYRSNNYSILSMLFRGGEFSSKTSETLGMSLIIARLIRPISMLSFLYYYILPKRNKLVLLILFSLAIITTFPLGMARFEVAALYIPFFLIVFPLFKGTHVLSITITAGLLFIFPFLNNFRYFTSNTQIKFGLDFNMFLQGHFDSYQNFAIIVLEDIITWGRQLLGVFLFWIPRSIWTNKPIGSGAYISELGHIYFPNASANFFAEGYINFGFLGVFLFIIAFAYFTAIFDKTYWTLIHRDKNNYFKIIYYLIIGMTIFILRGDLMSGFSYTLTFVFSFLIVRKILNRR